MYGPGIEFYSTSILALEKVYGYGHASLDSVARIKGSLFLKIRQFLSKKDLIN